MLYNFLRFLILITTKIFFNSIYLRNIEQIPQTGPLIIAPNHPSTFLDPLVTCAWINRPIYFLTNGGAFSSPFKKWLYKQLHMIPIYRKQDSDEASSKNESAFRACFEFLEKGGALMIFPEGSSENERRLRKIKTGLARIALGAESQNNFSLNVKVVCVGVNYTNPRKFQSKLFVNFDNPINALDFKEAYEEDNFEGVRLMTSEVEKRLLNLIVKTSNERFDKLVRKIETLYSNDLKETLNLTENETEQIFIIAQHISNAVDYYQEKEQERVIKLEEKINNYFALLDSYKIRDLTVSKIASKKQAITKLFKYIPQLILGFPIYLFGLLHNYLPYQIPAIIATKSTKDVTYRGPVNFVSGILTFGIFYLFYTGFFFYLTMNSILTLIYTLLLIPTGFFSFYYWNYLLRVFEEFRLFSKFKANSQSYELRELRDEIISELERTKEEYLAS